MPVPAVHLQSPSHQPDSSKPVFSFADNWFSINGYTIALDPANVTFTVTGTGSAADPTIALVTGSLTKTKYPGSADGDEKQRFTVAYTVTGFDYVSTYLLTAAKSDDPSVKDISYFKFVQPQTRSFARPAGDPGVAKEKGVAGGESKPGK
jgi:hypothetical protein